MIEVVTAVISAVVTLAVCLITNNSHQKNMESLVEYKIDELTKRVDKHNNLIERTYQLEKDVALLKAKEMDDGR